MNTFRVYKPNKQATGTASQWQLSFKKDEKYNPWKLFYEMAKQTGIDEKGNARFDWENAIRVKMDIPDLGEILAVLEQKQQQVGNDGKIFHKTDSNNKIINFFYNENSKNYFMKVSRQTAEGVVAFQQNMTIGEGCALSILLKEAIVKLSCWGTRNVQKNYSNPNLQVSPDRQNTLPQAM